MIFEIFGGDFERSFLAFAEGEEAIEKSALVFIIAIVIFELGDFEGFFDTAKGGLGFGFGDFKVTLISEVNE